MVCPLCYASNIETFQTQSFLRCHRCQLIFRPESEHLSIEGEKARYSHHQNNTANQGYLDFLKPAADAVLKLAKPGDRGLDFGCGPEPVLANTLIQKGFAVSHYDPNFFDQKKLEVDWDFITCTEVVEHFRQPGRDFLQMLSLLKPEGFCVVMTQIYEEGIRLQDWYYARDKTHLCFYSPETFHWISRKCRRPVEIVAPRLILFKGRETAGD